MTKTYEIKDKKAFRVFISRDDLKAWGLEDVKDDIIRQWIRLGIKKESEENNQFDLGYLIETVENKFERQEKMITNLSLFCSKYLHQIVMATINLELDLYHDAKDPSERDKLEEMRLRMDHSLKAQKKFFQDLSGFDYSTFFEGQKKYFSCAIHGERRN